MMLLQPPVMPIGTHTSGEQARSTSCTSSRVVDYIALLIVGRRGVYTSLVANGFALLRCHFNFRGKNQSVLGVLTAKAQHADQTQRNLERRVQPKGNKKQHVQTFEMQHRFTLDACSVTFRVLCSP